MDADILSCGHPPSDHGPHTTGYGVTEDGKRICWTCCADADRARMIETGRATLYLVSRIAPACETYTGIGARPGPTLKYKVANWPDSLSFPVTRIRVARRGGGFGADRVDVWFTGPDGKPWHGVNRGDNQIARCRRLKG